MVDVIDDMPLCVECYARRAIHTSPAYGMDDDGRPRGRCEECQLALLSAALTPDEPDEFEYDSIEISINGERYQASEVEFTFADAPKIVFDAMLAPPKEPLDDRDWSGAYFKNASRAHLNGLQLTAAMLYETARAYQAEPEWLDSLWRAKALAQISFAQRMAADVSRAERILRGVG
jgi:hypothetical protein